MNAKTKKALWIGGGVSAICLFIYLFATAKNASAVSVDATPDTNSQAPTDAGASTVGGNVYNFDGLGTGTPTGVAGNGAFNVVVGGNTIGNNCGCCDSGSQLVPQSNAMANIASTSTGNDALLTMLANISNSYQTNNSLPVSSNV